MLLRSSASSVPRAARYASIGTFESTTMLLPPGSLTTMSGRSRRPVSSRSLSCSWKSQCWIIPASSTTRFSCTSPQRPRMCGARRAVTRLPVSSRSRSCPLVTSRSCSPTTETSFSRFCSRARASVSKRWRVSLIGASLASVIWRREVWLFDKASPVTDLKRSSHCACERSSSEICSAAARLLARDGRPARAPSRPEPDGACADGEPNDEKHAGMSRRTLLSASDGRAGRHVRPERAGKQNQPRRVRRPTGAECRIQRLRRATGSDART